MGGPMSANATIDKLLDMKLKAMAENFRIQLNDQKMSELSFEARFAILVEAEFSSRHNSKLKRMISTADFELPSASLYDINYTSGRKLNQELITKLGTCQFIKDNLNVIITGATGSGKTFLACALGIEACKKFYSTKYIRMPDLLLDLELSKDKKDSRKELEKYVKPSLLIVDDWLIYNVEHYLMPELFSIVHGRYNKKSTILCSQVKVEGWYQQMTSKSSPLTDAIMDRIIHNSYKIDITAINQNCDLSMREVYGLKFNNDESKTC